MLFLSITRPELLQHIPDQTEAIELRLDLFPEIDVALIRGFLQNSTRPVMLTLRNMCEPEREGFVRELLALGPHFFDLDYDMRPEFLHEVFTSYPKTKFVLSYHNFQGVPPNVEEIYYAMAKYPAYSYKIAVMVSSSIDALKMLKFAQVHPKTSVICMGEKGEFARVLGPVVGNLINFACLNCKDQAAPGQLTVAELMDTYHYPSLNAQTAIYGLIGDPVVNSPGHLYHNAVFRRLSLNAVYVKMTVKPEELGEFISLAKDLNIRGLSVTIPLKEAVVSFVEKSAEHIGAFNTLLLEEGRIFGANTDGWGALDAIEKKMPVSGKKVVLLGAGGAARSIACEAKARGAHVMILNRTVRRAQELAMDMGCEAGGLEDVPHDYDILINCSPDLPIAPQLIRAGTVAMDIVYYPRETTFLKEASLKKCQIVDGEEMFVNQAAGQTAFWMGA